MIRFPRRPLVLGIGGLLIALSILWLSLPLADAAAPDSLTIRGSLTSADHESSEGYFAIGSADAAIIARPGTDLHHWLTAHRGQAIVITFREDRGVK